MRKSLVIGLITYLSVCGLVAGASAQSTSVSQDEAAAQVRQETGGRVLGVKSETQGGVVVYLVKVLLADGRVRIVTVSSK